MKLIRKKEEDGIVELNVPSMVDSERVHKYAWSLLVYHCNNANM